MVTRVTFVNSRELNSTLAVAPLLRAALEFTALGTLFT
jgi:hypothetical protein